MHSRLFVLIVMTIWILVRSGFALGQFQSNQSAPHIHVSLLSEHINLVQGTSSFIGVLLSPDPEWHTYWRNPGDSGEAPVINLSSNSNLIFGDIQWPLPQAIPVAHLVNYGYSGQILLMIPVSVPEQVSREQVHISAELSWLVCKEDCIPGYATLGIQLPVSETLASSGSSSLFAETRKRLPKEQWLQGKFETNDETIVIELKRVINQTADNDFGADDWRLFPFRSDVVQHATTQQSIFANEVLRSVVAKSLYFDGQAETLQWLLSNGETGFYVSTNNNVTNVEASSTESHLTETNLGILLIMAFIGGLLLNLMPCVLPVLSIKALSLHTSQTGLSIKLAYLLGVLFCFNLFAIVIILLQAGGQQIGWGFQMQEPAVIIVLSFLFTFIALVLLDAFYVGSRFAGIGQSLISGNGWSSNFFTGVLAVVVASPCTAPFMAAALGVALVSEPPVTLLLFNALALGFALPLTLLFISKRFNRLMPQPGEWMNNFKRALAFPMLLTVAWLCWIYAGQTDLQAQFVLLIALILFCMSLWLSAQTSSKSIKAILAIVVLLCFSLPFYLTANMHPAQQKSAQITAHYMAYSADALARLRAQKSVVLVNMTADWCITCKVNEQVAFSDAEVKKLLRSERVTYMVGDWTNKNDAILTYLHQYERAGVPLYVIYAGEKSIQVLPQILTPNRVVTALNQAIKEISND